MTIAASDTDRAAVMVAHPSVLGENHRRVHHLRQGQSTSMASFGSGSNLAPRRRAVQDGAGVDLVRAAAIFATFVPSALVYYSAAIIEKSIIEFTKYTNFLYLLPHHAHNQQPAT